MTDSNFRDAKIISFPELTKFIFLQIYYYFVKPTRITVFFRENVFFEVFARMLLISLFSFCWLIFRLGGTGLGLTEEVEDVGDLHRGELLAVLAVTGGGELLEKVGDALDPSHQVSTGYCWSSIGKIQKS